MSDGNEPRDSGLVLHRWLQWISTISTGVLVALVVSGMDTWDALKAQSVRMENVPGDIKEIKLDVNDLKNETMGLKWKVSAMETSKTKH